MIIKKVGFMVALLGLLGCQTLPVDVEPATPPVAEETIQPPLPGGLVPGFIHPLTETELAYYPLTPILAPRWKNENRKSIVKKEKILQVAPKAEAAQKQKPLITPQVITESQMNAPISIEDEKTFSEEESSEKEFLRHFK